MSTDRARIDRRFDTTTTSFSFSLTLSYHNMDPPPGPRQRRVTIQPPGQDPGPSTTFESENDSPITPISPTMPARTRARSRRSSSPRVSLPQLFFFAATCLAFFLVFGIGSMAVKDRGLDVFSSFGFGFHHRYPSAPSSERQIPDNHKCYSPKHGFTCNPEVMHNLGQFSPFYRPNSTVLDQTDGEVIKSRCKLKQVNFVARHGSRSATRSRTIAYDRLIARLKQSVPESALVGKWAFFKDYEYNMMPKAEMMTKFGEQESYQMGKRFYDLYGDLLADRVDSAKRKKASVIPGLFMRAGNIPRVVVTAQNFSDGFYGSVKRGQDVGPVRPILAIDEDEATNNTLHHTRCTAFEEWKVNFDAHGTHTDWERSMTQPIADRLTAELSGGNNASSSSSSDDDSDSDDTGKPHIPVVINTYDVISLFELCAFETSDMLASDLGSLHPFCHLFDPAEFKLFDYYHSLRKYYLYGPGSDLGPAQGAGYVRELVARMTDTPVAAVGSVNATLDADFATFPFGPDWAVFADFSHDNDMMGMYGALGLFPVRPSRGEYTPPDRVDGFANSWVATFGARLAVEKWDCGERDGEEDRVVVTVNERVVPVRWCAEPVTLRNGEKSTDGGQGLAPTSCRLGKFVDGIMANGDYGWNEKCYVPRHEPSVYSQ